MAAWCDAIGCDRQVLDRRMCLEYLHGCLSEMDGHHPQDHMTTTEPDPKTDDGRRCTSTRWRRQSGAPRRYRCRIGTHPSRPRRRITTGVREDLKTASDANLVFSISRWREEALAEAYRRHAGAVYGLARRVLRDEAMSEEVVQEVFLRLWNQPDRFDPDRGSLRSFLLAQAHGRAVDVLRSEMARRLREEREARETAVAGYDLELEVFDITVADQLRSAVGNLPVDERRAIELAYLGGHSYREVAELLATPEGTVKSRIRSGLKRMHANLVGAGIGFEPSRFEGEAR